MKKHLKKLFLLMLIFTPLIFSGCKPNAYYGNITSISAITGDEEVLLSWTNTELYDGYTLNVEVQKDGQWIEGFTITSGTSILITKARIEEAQSEGYFPNGELENGTTYTFIVYTKDKSGSLVHSKSTTATPSASNEIVIDADDIDDAFTEIPKDKGIVKITGINGKSVAYVNYNSSTSKEIVAGNERYFLGAAGGYTSKATSNIISANTSSRAALSEDAGMTMPEIKEPLTRPFIAPEKVTVIKSSARAAETDEEEETFDINSPAIGQTHYIWVDNNYAMNQLVKEKMTLYAIGNQTTGTEMKIKALVWANPDNLAETASGNKLSLDVIEDIIKKYSKYYALEEDIFGETGDFILNKSETDNELSKEDMSDYPTSTYINIVLTDIGKDYNSSKQTGVVGYFWGKDYYNEELVSYSNEGKYFYIDIPFCNYNSSATSTEERYSGTGGVSDMVISTLFHEYQHMIHFNQKYGVESDEDTTWYNEMLSMLCEDIMAETLGLDETVQDERIPTFNIYYPLSGISEYLDSESWISYGTAYAFGAWLARNYGGVNLVEKMSKNAYVGKESVVNAVNSINSTNLTWEALVKEYLQAVVFRSAYSQENDLPTFNKTPKGSDWTRSIDIKSPTIKIATSLETPAAFANTTVSADTISGSFNGINLWSDAFAYEEGNHKLYGPLPFNSGEYDIRPDGFVIHSTGSNWDGGDYDYVKLYFTGSSSDTEKLYLFVQDGFSYFTEDTTAAEVIN
ncbi:MAG: hypothetical protein K6D95_10880 [Treponema sp.]|nr:hypothetical protein [Treponema sp.]